MQILSLVLPNRLSSQVEPRLNLWQDRLYEQCLVCGPVTQLAYVADQLVGAIACRLEGSPDGARLHIMTLGVLSACRNMGIGSELLRRSLKVGVHLARMFVHSDVYDF